MTELIMNEKIKKETQLFNTFLESIDIDGLPDPTSYDLEVIQDELAALVEASSKRISLEHLYIIASETFAGLQHLESELTKIEGESDKVNVKKIKLHLKRLKSVILPELTILTNSHFRKQYLLEDYSKFTESTLFELVQLFLSMTENKERTQHSNDLLRGIKDTLQKISNLPANSENYNRPKNNSAIKLGLLETIRNSILEFTSFFIDSPDIQIVTRNIFVVSDFLCQRLSQELVLSVNEDIPEVKRLTEEANENLSIASNYLTKFLEKSESALSSLKSHEEKAKDTLNQNFREHFNEIGSVVNDSLRKVDRSITNGKDDAINQISKAALNGEKELRESLEKPIQNLSQRIEEQVTQFESKRAYMDEMLEKLGLASDANVTLQQANKEETAANDLRTKGLSLLYLSIALLVLFFSEFVGIDVVSNSSLKISDFTVRELGIPALLATIGLSLRYFKWLDHASHLNKTSLLASKILFTFAAVSTFFISSKYLGYEFFTEITKSGSDEYHLSMEDFAIRFMTILLVTSPAIYMLKESAAHRTKENLYRQRGTQLVAISGYLSDLDGPSKTEVKQKLAENFFSFYDGKPDTSNVPDFIKHMNDAVSLAKTINTSGSEEKAAPKKGLND